MKEPAEKKFWSSAITSRALALLGMGLTLVYCVVIAWHLEWSFEPLRKLTPNEFGDFLAGAAGPLALLWLVLGFLQQGIELRLSRDALLLQARELEKSVEQQTRLAEATRLSHDAEVDARNEERAIRLREAAPKFVSREVVTWNEINPGYLIRQLTVVNVGRMGTDVEVHFSRELPDFRPDQILVAEPGEPITFNWRCEEPWPGETSIVLYYTATDGHRGSVGFSFDLAPTPDDPRRMVCWTSKQHSPLKNESPA